MLFKKKKGALLGAAILAATVLFSGCGSEKQQAASMPTQVKAMKVMKQDTPLMAEYAGKIVGKNEVKVQSRVKGNIVAKYVQGGQFVEAGQPLYKIDSRQYESAVLQAQANLAQSQANLADATQDLHRYEELYRADAISEQSLTNQQAKVSSCQAAAAANAALLKKAQEDLDDTVVYSPLTGQLSVDDVSVGTYVDAGATTLVTVGSEDPIYAQFSVSENEYLTILKSLQGLQSQGADLASVTITLSDGSQYPLAGRIMEADRALAEQTGTLIVKALFPNPDGRLLPGMFARVKFTGGIVPNALLVPQRAVQQLLGKSFVMIVNGEGKCEARTVELGQQVGSYYIIKSGITTEDTIVVEGLTNLQEGKDLAVTMVTAQEMGFSLDPEMKNYNPDESGKKEK